MSYRQKDNINIEKDELNIKSHLNISLDKSGISVSEALIQRTLDAINKQSSVETSIEDIGTKSMKRIIPKVRYLRSIAGVAAAVLVVVAGLNVFNAFENKEMNDSSKKDSTPEILISADSAKEKAGEENAIYNGLAMDDKLDVADSNTKSAESNRQFINKSSAEDFTEQNNDDLTGIDNDKVTVSSVIEVSFGEMIAVDLNKLEYIKITNKENGSSVVLETPQDIRDFYTLMQPLTFMVTSIEEDNVIYEIEVKEQSEYILKVGTVLSISSNEDETTTDVVYSISDGEAMVKILSGYFQ